MPVHLLCYFLFSFQLNIDLHPFSSQVFNVHALILIDACFLSQVNWFSFDPDFHREKEQMCCYLTRTTKTTHQIIKDNLQETPTYGGWVDAKGPRYCPSIEDKVNVLHH